MHVHTQAFALAVAGILLGCWQASADPEVREITGTVRLHDLEGRFYAIHGDDQVNYDPINLPSDFQRDGLRVVATLRIRSNVVGTHMVGPIVEVLRIRQN